MSAEELLTKKFGQFGGRFVPAAFIGALDELERTYPQAVKDPDFIAELAHLSTTYIGRPSIIVEAKNFANHWAGATGQRSVW